MAGDNAKAKSDKSREIEAIAAIVEALEPLDPQARRRALLYAINVFSVDLTAQHHKSPSILEHNVEKSVLGKPIGAQQTLKDIRTLTQEKSPRSAVEMAALAAYYLSEEAPDKKEIFEVEDLKRLFKQGGFHLPTKPEMTLVHAKNAGYLDSLGKGKYKLNPVGYNLVVHGLPTEGDASTRVRRPRRQARRNRTSKRRRK